MAMPSNTADDTANRVVRLLDSASTRHLLTWLAGGLLGLAVIVAGQSIWRDVWTGFAVGGPGVVVALAIGAAVSFVLARNGSSVIAAARTVGLVVAYAVLTALLLVSPADAVSDRARAIAVGVVSVAFLLVATSRLAERSLSLSLSRTTSYGSTVMLLWSAVVVYALAFVAAIAMLNGVDTLVCPENGAAANCVMASAWSDYVILLGLPGAAAAIAQAEEKRKVSSLSATATNKITEVQHFTFNVLAMLVVVGGLWRSGVLGDVPDPLVALAGTSAATFALVKRVTPAKTGPDA